MKVARRNRFYWGMLGLLLFLAGCFGSQPETTQTDKSVADGDQKVAPLTIYSWTDEWNSAVEQVLGEMDDKKIAVFQVSDSGESLVIHRSWGEEANDTFVKLTGYVNKENGVMERIFVNGKQTDFGEEMLRYLQPYFEILIAMINPELSDDERSHVMKSLSLDGDVTLLAERSGVDGKNSVTMNDVRYDVVTIASSEGRTYALVATMSKACDENDILSPCR